MLDGIPIDKIGLPFFLLGTYITKYWKGEEKKNNKHFTWSEKKVINFLIEVYHKLTFYLVNKLCLTIN